MRTRQPILAFFLLAALVSTALAAVAPTPVAAQEMGDAPDANGPTACAGAESHRFDFWPGTWNVESRLRTDSGWVETTHTWTARTILGGCAFIDFADADFGDGHLRGMGSRYYRPDSDTWYITWMSTQAPGRLGIWEGSFDDDGSGTFLRKVPTPDGTVLSRIRWWDITDRSAEWEHAVSRDGGDSWTPTWRMTLTKVSAAGMDR
jgi:hypothetical protein